MTFVVPERMFVLLATTLPVTIFRLAAPRHGSLLSAWLWSISSQANLLGPTVCGFYIRACYFCKHRFQKERVGRQRKCDHREGVWPLPYCLSIDSV